MICTSNVKQSCSKLHCQKVLIEIHSYKIAAGGVAEGALRVELQGLVTCCALELVTCCALELVTCFASELETCCVVELVTCCAHRRRSKEATTSSTRPAPWYRGTSLIRNSPHPLAPPYGPRYPGLIHGTSCPTGVPRPYK